MSKKSSISAKPSPLQLPFNLLSNILSFLTEKEGIYTLLTNKFLYYRVLPYFELPPSTNTKNKCQRRYHFIESPVTDAGFLMARLNSRRLFQRRKYGFDYPFHVNTTDISKQEWRELEKCYENEEMDSMVAKIPPQLNLLHFEKSDGTGVTLLASYPRSGNSLLRSLFELISCRVTGSDTRPDRSLSKELALKYNMVGEGVTSPSKTPLVKTHFPERRGMAPFPTSKIILLVRNPCDAIQSYFHMTLTNTHTKTVTEDVYQSYFDLWEDMCVHEMQIWTKFHQYWLEKKDQLPMMIIRYEDLLRFPKEVMLQIIPFVFNNGYCDDRDSILWQRRIDHVFNSNNQSLHKMGSYKPRSGTIGTSFSKFSLELRHSMLESIASHLTIFDQLGYSSFLQWMQNDTTTMWDPSPNFCKKLQPNKPSSSFLIVNSGKELRDLNHPYGRNMTAWRKSQTDNDENPFSTVGDDEDDST